MFESRPDRQHNAQSSIKKVVAFLFLGLVVSVG